MSAYLSQLLGPDVPSSGAIIRLAPSLVADATLITQYRQALYSFWAIAACPRQQDFARAGDLCPELLRLMAALGSVRANRLARRWAHEWATATGIRPFGFPGQDK